MDSVTNTKQETKILKIDEKYHLRYFDSKNQLTQYAKDIIPGQYEGGFKLWDCTIDLSKYMVVHPQLFHGKKVMELGCGHGLLGILAKKLGASHVCLQDFNRDVIEKLTVQTVKINGQESNFQYMYGDWSVLKSGEHKFDIILGSELIYNEQTYLKLLGCIKQFMSEAGCCILANKIYYFGVGGSMAGFRKAVDSLGDLKCESLQKIVPNGGGNKKQIVRISY